MSEQQFNPTAALLAAAVNPKTTNQAYGIYKDLNHELQENHLRNAELEERVGKVIEAARLRTLN